MTIITIIASIINLLIYYENLKQNTVSFEQKRIYLYLKKYLKICFYLLIFEKTISTIFYLRKLPVLLFADD